MDFSTIFQNLAMNTGIAQMTWGNIIMVFICLLLIYLAIKKNFEPLLLLPIGFGGLLANVAVANIAGGVYDPATDMSNHIYNPANWNDLNPVQQFLQTPILEGIWQAFAGIDIRDVILNTPKDEGFLHYIFMSGVSNGLFPLFIFIGVGAMTDFGPLLAHPKTAILGAAAQFGIFTTLLGALALGEYAGFDFGLPEASAIGIIGGADGPTAIYLTSKLAPHILGAVAVAAYSYMALVPIIQPPIMRLFTTKKERQIEMKQLRHVGKREKIFFPLSVFLLCLLLLPDACPLVGALMLGNLMKESGVVDRLSKTAQNEFINIVTILLGITVGSKLSGDKFLQLETLGILVLGLAAFAIATASGVLIAKTMNLLSREKVNPLIGAAGVSAVPMAARVVNRVGLEENPYNFLLMHAMGPNVAGVIGSAVAAGVLIAIAG